MNRMYKLIGLCFCSIMLLMLVSAPARALGDPGDRYQDAKHIWPMVPESDIIHPSNDQDWYYFVLVRTRHIHLPTTSSGDIVMYLYQKPFWGDIEEIGYDDDSGEGQAAMISTCLRPGTYYIQITAYDSSSGATPQYSLDMFNSDCTNTSDIPTPENPYTNPYDVDDRPGRQTQPSTPSQPTTPSNPWDNATTIRMNEQQSASISPATDEDWFTFEITENRVSAYLFTTGESGDTYIELYDSAGNLIDYDDDNGNEGFSLIYYRCESPFTRGQYYVKVQSYEHQTTISNYRVGISMMSTCS